MSNKATATAFQQLLLILTFVVVDVSCFASSKKARRGSTTTKSGGFGAKKPVVFKHTPDESVETKSLVGFLNGFGAKGLFDGTEVGFDKVTGIRGMYATRAFKAGETLCKIPSDCAIALADPGLHGSDIPTVAHVGRNWLDMYLSDEEKIETWAPYLATLPAPGAKNFSPTPDYFSMEEIEALEFPPAVEAAKKRLEEIQTLAQESEGITMEDLQFATWLVSSRRFAISMKIEGGPEDALAGEATTRSVPVLVPYLDMANHPHVYEANAALDLIDPELDNAWFVFKAKRPIPAGKEITISYGSGVESSVELLTNYGFVPRENKFDSMMLKKGGDGVLGPDGWKTSLEEDRAALDLAVGPMKQVLELKIRLKESYEKTS